MDDKKIVISEDYVKCLNKKINKLEEVVKKINQLVNTKYDIYGNLLYDDEYYFAFDMIKDILKELHD